MSTFDALFPIPTGGRNADDMGMPGTASTSTASAAAPDWQPSIEQILAARKDAPPDPIGEWMRSRGFPPERSLLVLPLAMRADLQFAPRYVRFSAMVDAPVLCHDLRRADRMSTPPNNFWERCVAARCVVVPVRVFSGFDAHGNLNEALFVGIRFAALPFDDDAFGPEYWFMLEDQSSGLDKLFASPDEALASMEAAT